MPNLSAALGYTKQMIVLLTGDNTFETQRELTRISAAFSGQAEVIDGSRLETRQLPDLLMGATLFAETRLVIIKGLSENKSVWADFGLWLERVSSDIQLVLVEIKPDKRTATYKALKQHAQVVESVAWTDRDARRAEQWVLEEAQRQTLTLDPKSAQLLVARVGFEQWALFRALEKLALVDSVTPAVIESLIDATPAENVFNLFDAALRGNVSRVVQMVRDLELTEDPYRLFALLSGQAFQLAAVIFAGPDDAVAKDFGVHPYAVSKLTTLAAQQGRSGAQRIITAFAQADDDMKLSRAEPWFLIERTLLRVATKK